MLREAQIQRYSRQILLSPVGGVGQERLLALGLRWYGGGDAAQVAAAYLAAGGSSLAPDSGDRPGAPGFLVAAAQTGQAAEPALRAALLELNEDALARPGQRPAVLAEAPFDPALEAAVRATGQPRVLLGAVQGVARVAAVSAAGCGHCLWSLAAPLEAVPPSLAAATGTLAALSLQRLVLELGAPQQAWRLFPDARIEPEPWPGCARCALPAR